MERRESLEKKIPEILRFFLRVFQSRLTFPGLFLDSAFIHDEIDIDTTKETVDSWPYVQKSLQFIDH